MLPDYRSKTSFKSHVKFLSENKEEKLKQHLKDAVCFFVGTDKAEMGNKGALVIHFKFLLPGARSEGAV